MSGYCFCKAPTTKSEGQCLYKVIENSQINHILLYKWSIQPPERDQLEKLTLTRTFTVSKTERPFKGIQQHHSFSAQHFPPSTARGDRWHPLRQYSRTVSFLSNGTPMKYSALCLLCLWLATVSLLTASSFSSSPAQPILDGQVGCAQTQLQTIKTSSLYLLLWIGLNPLKLYSTQTVETEQPDMCFGNAALLDFKRYW